VLPRTTGSFLAPGLHLIVRPCSFFYCILSVRCSWTVQSLHIIGSWSAGTRRATVSCECPSETRRGRTLHTGHSRDICPSLAWLAADVLLRPVKANQGRRRYKTFEGNRASRGRFLPFPFFSPFCTEIISPPPEPLAVSWML
jgi:hypothetical protein